MSCENEMLNSGVRRQIKFKHDFAYFVKIRIMFVEFC